MDRPLPIVSSIPTPFAERMRSLLGPEAEDLLAALEQPPLTGLRVNTLKLSPEALRAHAPWPLERVPWCAAGFLVAGDAQPGRHPFHAAGLYYLQEPSAMAVAEALAPQPGEWVLDLAAAPGGKATHLAALIDDRGLLVANEIEARRIAALTSNLERWGVRRVVIANEQPARLAGHWGPIFDRVLFDAPCSGEGMFRKSPEARRAWSPEVVRGCALRQDQALLAAAELVRPGGALVYSTCTFAPEENEQVIARFLARRRDFELVPVALPAVAPGRPDWVDPALAMPDLARTARLWPHRVSGEGHFIALLRRGAGAPVPVPRARVQHAPRRARELWRAFALATLGGDPFADMPLIVRGTRLYALPEGLPPLEGLRIVQAGLWLGTLRHDRLEPAHSLALALRSGADGHDAVHPPLLDLAPDDEHLARYLQGQAIEAPGSPGWVLIAVAGFPLGWGRRVGTIVKNAYPKGLRRPLV